MCAWNAGYFSCGECTLRPRGASFSHDLRVDLVRLGRGTASDAVQRTRVFFRINEPLRLRVLCYLLRFRDMLTFTDVVGPSIIC